MEDYPYFRDTNSSQQHRRTILNCFSLDNVGRSIFVDRLCCSRAVDDPSLQVPEKQVDTEEHYNNYNNYDKTKRNGDDDHDDANNRDGDLCLISYPGLPPPVHDRVRYGHEMRIFPYRPGECSKELSAYMCNTAV